MRDLILNAVNPALAILVPVFALWLATLLRAHIKNQMVAQGLALLDYAAVNVVAQIYQQTVADLKDPTKPGTWTQEIAANAKKTAVADLKLVVPQALAMLTACGHSQASLDATVSAAIENAVLKLKNQLPTSLTLMEGVLAPVAPVVPAAPAAPTA